MRYVCAMQWIAMSMVVMLACGRSDSKAPPKEVAAAPMPKEAQALEVLEPWEAATLACVARSTVEHMNASKAAFDVAAAALSTDRARAHRRLRHWIAAFTAAAYEHRTKPPRVEAQDLFGLAAVAQAELGDLRTARELAEQTLAAARGEDASRDPIAVKRAYEVLAWTGDGARAAKLAGDQLFDRALVASGLARGGDAAGARKLLATLTDEAATADRSVRGVIVMAHVYAGDLAAARALITAERDPDDRAMLYAWAADAMRHTTDAGRAAFLDDAIAAVSADARPTTPGSSVATIAWIELVKARDQIDGDRSARARLHVWLLDPAHAATLVELIALNVVRTEVAGMPAEADRLLALLPAQHRTRAELDLDLLRGRFDRAFALLDAHRRDRTALRSRAPDLDNALRQGIDAVETDLWLAFTDAPRDPAQIATFQKLLCR